ncbi:MAG TPA: heparinase II/III family protein [archaeon]|nr:heparinase II/III family protein [archaeon]
MTKARFKNPLFFILFPVFLLTISCSPQKSPHQGAVPRVEDDWKSAIRSDHPRLFFNSETWSAVKARALNEESALYEDIQARVDQLAAQKLEAGDYGTQAAEAAFVFLVSGDEKYFDLARSLLSTSLDYYHQRFAERKTVSWYSFSRINAWAAYDWLFNSLSPEERKELGRSFLEAVGNVVPTSPWKGNREAFENENWSGPESGFYGTSSLLWYAGLATYKDGTDDQLSEKFLTEGYGLFIELLEHRSSAAGDDGGSSSASLNYALAAYPWAEFNFFHTFRSATGKNIALDWPYVACLPGYIFWNWLPGGKNFGTGDSYHATNKIPLNDLNIHLSQMIHFYAGKMPEYAAFTKWMLEMLPREKRSSFPYARFLLTGTQGPPALQGPPGDLPLARHFENMGQVFFRSGSGPDDTYALFTVNGTLENHKHFDNLNFVIYKKGFLALDSGTRPEPGIHLYNYYCRTVAHNCVLIQMPGEQMPSYWGKSIGIPAPGEEAVPPPNDGGQREVLGSKVLAFESCSDYAYVAGDATGCYHQDKCRLALRQFVFIPPDFFIVFDRVSSTRPEYKKTWLLHTATEPSIRQKVFSADQDEGRLFCRTILPENVSLTRIGGPGKQFWSGDRNWPLPGGYRTPDSTQLLGQWRVEVSPAEQNSADLFLHLIQVGDQSLKAMVGSELVKKDNQVGVRFAKGELEWEVLFGSQGEPSGRIRITKNNVDILERKLTGMVSPQKGIFGSN